MKDLITILLFAILIFLGISILLARSGSKYQVCKTYSPEINRYPCIFITLPIYLGTPGKR